VTGDRGGTLPPGLGVAVSASGRDEQVDHPAHYNAHPSGVEAITITEWFSFNLGNAIKYAWRAGLKPGTDAITDLEKCRWYLDREIARLRKQREDGDL
jgi:Protein of unknwon function (DUF3310)